MQFNDAAVLPNHDDGQPIDGGQLKTALETNYETKYKSTLMNRTYAPFVEDCIKQVSNASQASGKPITNICATYFDMMYNIFPLPGFDTADAIKQIIRDIDNATIVHYFCENFPGEVSTGLATHPFTDTFADRTPVPLEQQVQRCAFDCFASYSEIKPICKLILGGCRFIKQSKRSPSLANSPSDVAAPPKANVTLSQSNDSSVIKAAKPEAKKSNVSAKETSNKLSVPDVTKGTGGAADNVSPVVGKPPNVPAQQEADAGKANIISSNSNAIKDEQIEDNDGGEAEQGDTLTNEQVPVESRDDSGYDDENKDKQGESTIRFKSPSPCIIAGNNKVSSNSFALTLTVSDYQTDDLPPPQIDDTPNSNNLLSQQSAGFNQVHVDPDSSFFSYFMFLMLVVIAVYVAYHNKSKILALLIEGRRSRTYSSRNGSRRKAHSAEYRKLDSNLEEAIQSGGGSQGLSTQIIY